MKDTTQNTREQLTFWVTFMISVTLCVSVLAMVAAFLLGLWAKEVDNGEIFKMIAPAFSTLIGGMIGFRGVRFHQCLHGVGGLFDHFIHGPMAHRPIELAVDSIFEMDGGGP